MPEKVKARKEATMYFVTNKCHNLFFPFRGSENIYHEFNYLIWFIKRIFMNPEYSAKREKCLATYLLIEHIVFNKK